MIRLYAQEHLALVMRELRERSGGRFKPSSQTVYSALHRLERNRLIERGYPEFRRYMLTTSGRRSLETKRREFESFVAGVHAVLEQRASPSKSRPTTRRAGSP